MVVAELMLVLEAVEALAKLDQTALQAFLLEKEEMAQPPH
jgi:hypothetical protein